VNCHMHVLNKVQLDIYIKINYGIDIIWAHHNTSYTSYADDHQYPYH